MHCPVQRDVQFPVRTLENFADLTATTENDDWPPKSTHRTNCQTFGLLPIKVKHGVSVQFSFEWSSSYV